LPQKKSGESSPEGRGDLCSQANPVEVPKCFRVYLQLLKLQLPLLQSYLHLKRKMFV